jgi:hypothetical protein
VPCFDVDAFRKHCLLNGLDDIGLTLQEADAIGAYETQRKQAAPWLLLTNNTLKHTRPEAYASGLFVPSSSQFCPVRGVNLGQK